MGGKEEIDVLAMKLDLHIMVGGTVYCTRDNFAHSGPTMNTL